MKRIFFAAMLLMGISVVLSSCNKSEEDVFPIGTIWKATYSTSTNKTASVILKIGESMLSFSDDTHTLTYPYTLNGNTISYQASSDSQPTVGTISEDKSKIVFKISAFGSDLSTTLTFYRVLE